jgi:hypothetical protein
MIIVLLVKSGLGSSLDYPDVSNFLVGIWSDALGLVMTGHVGCNGERDLACVIQGL